MSGNRIADLRLAKGWNAVEATINTLFKPESLAWLYQASNGGFDSGSRLYRGHDKQRWRTLRPCWPVKIQLQQGELLCILSGDGATPVLLLPINEEGRSDFSAIGLQANAHQAIAEIDGLVSTGSTQLG